MSIEKIEKALEGNEKAGEIVSLVKTLLAQEAETYKTKKSELNQENQSVRKRMNKFSDALKDLGVDIDSDDISGLVKGIKGKLENSAPKTELEKVQAELTTITDKLASAEKREKDSMTKANQAKIKTDILAALTEQKAIKPDMAVRLVMPDVQTENLHTEEFTAQMKMGDQTLSIKDGVTQFLKDNPEFVSNGTHPGGGTGGDPGGRGKPDNSKDLDARREHLRANNVSIL